MQIIGLTGGIGSGKSTVAAMLAKANIPVIDADKIAHEVTKPKSPALEKIRKIFGHGVMCDDGSLNRIALAKIVFNDKESLERLEDILHPLVEQLSQQILMDLKKKGHEIAVYMAPLIFEKNIRSKFDKVLLIVAQRELVLDRLSFRDSLSIDDAKKRLAAQLPDSEKIKMADEVIHNNGSLKDLEQNLKDAWRKLTGASI